jgi:hypothetical protein
LGVAPESVARLCRSPEPDWMPAAWTMANGSIQDHH